MRYAVMTSNQSHKEISENFPKQMWVIDYAHFGTDLKQLGRFWGFYLRLPRVST